MVKRLAVVDAERCVGCQACMFACARRFGEGGLANSCIGVRSAGGVRKGYVVIVCRACQNPPCARVCPTDALIVREKMAMARARRAPESRPVHRLPQLRRSLPVWRGLVEPAGEQAPDLRLLRVLRAVLPLRGDRDGRNAQPSCPVTLPRR